MLVKKGEVFTLLLLSKHNSPKNVTAKNKPFGPEWVIFLKILLECHQLPDHVVGIISEREKEVLVDAVERKLL